MDAIKAIKTRFSIRQYTDKIISNKILCELIELGMNAPSAGNEKPWHFIIINNKELLNKIPDFHNHSKMLTEASSAILVCFDINLEKHKGMAVQDCSAATENILIAANAKGLGSVWLGIYPKENRMKGMKNLLDIPKNIIPFSLISLGYPKNIENKNRIIENNRIHYNMWNNYLQ
jgi:nitroreductase